MSSLFTKIRQGELPGHKIWDDGSCFAILTIEPIREGHLLVIPYEEVDHWVDMDDETTAHVFKVSRLLSETMAELFPCEKVGIMIAGLEVRHTHIHLVPIQAIADLNFALAKPREDALQAETAMKLRQRLIEKGRADHVPSA